MSKKTEKRLLINEDKNLLKAICKDLNQFTPKLKTLKKNYDALQIGKFTNEIFKELINKGSYEIAIKYRQTLEDQLDTLHVVSTVMRKNLLDKHDIFVKDFKEALLGVTSFYPRRFSRDNSPTLELIYISYVDNFFVISKQDVEKITERFCRTYLVTDTEVKAWNTINNLNEAYSDLKDILSGIGYDSFRGFESMNQFITDSRNPVVKPIEIKEIFLQLEKKKLYNEARVRRQL